MIPEKLKSIDLLSDGIRSDFWVLYLKPVLIEELEATKKALMGCQQDRVPFMQGKAQCLSEIMERPTNDIKTLLAKEKKNEQV